MKTHLFTTLAIAALPIACSTQSPPPAQPPAQPPPSSAPAVAATGPAAEAPPADKSAAEVKQDDAAQRLANDRAKMLSEVEAEKQRLTPELREKGKALSEGTYWTLDSGMKAALESPHRKPGNAARDSQRHPLETLKFFGVQPNSKVLEYGPGGGWYTELLAPVLARRGKLYITMGNAEGPKEQRSTYYAERVKLFLDTAPELYGKVERVVVDGAPQLSVKEPLDVALVIRGMHGMVRDGSLNAWLDQIHEALKYGGTLGVVQHRAAADADPQKAAASGYLPEAWLIEQIEARGFKLKEKSEINANPKDTKDYPDGVWDLPPTLRKGEQDKAKYVAIGESDRMTLRFAKVAKPAISPPKQESKAPQAAPQKVAAQSNSAAPQPAAAPPAKSAAAPATATKGAASTVPAASSAPPKAAQPPAAAPKAAQPPAAAPKAAQPPAAAPKATPPSGQAPAKAPAAAPKAP